MVRRHDILLLLLLVLDRTIRAEHTERTIFPKCCENGLLVDENFLCVAFHDVNDTVFDVLDIRNKGSLIYTVYFKSGEGGTKVATNNITEVIQDPGDRCLDIFPNKTIVVLKINEPAMHNATTEKCNSLFTVLKFWGATMVIFANIIYMIPYLIVIAIYYAISDLRHRAYDRAVVCYNITQIILNSIIIGMGWAMLCHKKMPPIGHQVIGLALMYLTLVSTLWLFVICFDMTLVITRFRWAPSSDSNRHQERRKVLIYSGLGWGIALIPTSLAAIVELTPWVPKSSAFKPNFDNFGDEPNLAVIIYVAVLPALVCATNSVLFFYTTYRMFVMKKSTSMATQSSTKRAQKKYKVYFRLYLLMDAPWITAGLAATFPDLWILKFLRMIQPILMLLAIVPPKTLAAAFRQWFGCNKQENKDNTELQNTRAVTAVS